MDDFCRMLQGRMEVVLVEDIILQMILSRAPRYFDEAARRGGVGYENILVGPGWYCNN